MLNSYLFIIALATVLCWSDSYIHSKRLYSSKLYAKQYENGELVSLLHPDAINGNSYTASTADLMFRLDFYVRIIL
jgi:hypothetical protein